VDDRSYGSASIVFLDDVSKHPAGCILNGQDLATYGLQLCCARFHAAHHRSALLCSSSLSVSYIARYVRISDSEGSSTKMQRCV
jgi:hypothetical protein